MIMKMEIKIEKLSRRAFCEIYSANDQDVKNLFFQFKIPYDPNPDAYMGWAQLNALFLGGVERKIKFKVEKFIKDGGLAIAHKVVVDESKKRKKEEIRKRKEELAKGRDNLDKIENGNGNPVPSGGPKGQEISTPFGGQSGYKKKRRKSSN